MKLLLDEDLSPRIAQALRKLGVDAVSVDVYGDRPAAFLFDFVSDPERPA